MVLAIWLLLSIACVATFAVVIGRFTSDCSYLKTELSALGALALLLALICQGIAAYWGWGSCSTRCAPCGWCTRSGDKPGASPYVELQQTSNVLAVGSPYSVEPEPPRSRAAMVAKRACIGFLFFMMVITTSGAVALGVVSAVWISVARVPMTGTLSGLTGLQGPVSVTRDKQEVVHITAGSRHDAHFAQGFVHAQERLWQMEFQRRVGAGRLAEVAGAAALKIDKLALAVGFYEAAQSAWDVLASRKLTSADAVQAYTDGVNAYLKTRHSLPLEFHLLGYAPEPWTTADTIVWSKLMSWDLSANMAEELVRFHLNSPAPGKDLPKERVQQLVPSYNSTRFPIALSSAAISPAHGGPGNATACHQNSWAPASASATHTSSAGLAQQQRHRHRATSSQPERLPEPRAAPASTASAQQCDASDASSGTGRCGLRAGLLSTASRWSAGESLSALVAELVLGSSAHAFFSEKFVTSLVSLGSHSAEAADVLPWMSMWGAGHDGWRSLGASNDWVVSGEHTVTGKPMLANDPHLMLTAPAIWILNHLEVTDKNDPMNVIGVSFPGLPGVVLGHNDHIAWGVTNTGVDVQDLYQLNTFAAGSRYAYNGQQVPFNKTTYLIKVKHGSNVDLTIRKTSFGRVVTDADVWGDAPGGTDMALRWVSTDPTIPDTTMQAFLDINFATDWADFRAALGYFVAPSQNFVYADVQGNIGYQMPGAIPTRVPEHLGLYPVPFADDLTAAWQWTGFVPYDSLPRTLNPPEGFVVTANNRITPPDYPCRLAAGNNTRWNSGAAGYRALRITERIQNVLRSGRKITLGDMKDIQLDVYSHLAADLVSATEVAVAPHTAKLSAAGAQLLADFQAWDYVMHVGDELAPWFARYYRQISKIGTADTGSSYWMSDQYQLAALRQGDSACQPDGDCGLVAVSALNSVAGQRVAEGATSQRWGIDVHHAMFSHMLLNQTAFRCIATRVAQHGGDRSTPNVGAFGMSDTFLSTAGPSYRGVWDLASIAEQATANQPTESVYLNPLGQSGNMLDSNYDDLLPLWESGNYLSAVLQADGSGVQQQDLKP